MSDYSFRLGDRVRATKRINEGYQVEPGAIGKILQLHDEYGVYKYAVNWDNGYFSYLIADYEIEAESETLPAIPVEALLEAIDRVRSPEVLSVLEEMGYRTSLPQKKVVVNFKFEVDEDQVDVLRQVFMRQTHFAGIPIECVSYATN